jgi:hypothetical protein
MLMESGRNTWWRACRFINSGVIRITRLSLPLRSYPAHGKNRCLGSDTHLGQVNYGLPGMLPWFRTSIGHCFYRGDFYDGVAVDLDKVIEPFHESPPLTAPISYGNHEEFSDNPYLDAVRRAGIGFI